MFCKENRLGKLMTIFQIWTSNFALNHFHPNYFALALSQYFP